MLHRVTSPWLVEANGGSLTKLGLPIKPSDRGTGGHSPAKVVLVTSRHTYNFEGAGMEAGFCDHADWCVCPGSCCSLTVANRMENNARNRQSQTVCVAVTRGERTTLGNNIQ